MLKRMMFLTVTAILILIFCFIVFAKSAERTAAIVSHGENNRNISFYTVEGKKCIGIKDVAAILSDTKDRFDFSVSDDNDKIIIEYGKNYSGDELPVFEEKSPGYTSMDMVFQIDGVDSEFNIYQIENEYFLSIDDLSEIVKCNVNVDMENSKIYINKDIDNLSDISENASSLKVLSQIFDKRYIDKARENIKQKFLDTYGNESFSVAMQEKLNSDSLCHSFQILEKDIKIKIFTKEVSVPFSEISDFVDFNIKNYAVISIMQGEVENQGLWNVEVGVESSAAKVLTESAYSENKNQNTEVKIDTNRPVVALTFDDGPKNGTTEKILDVLEKYNAKATFFVVGEMVEKAPELVKREYDLGCQVGNHSYSHPILTNLSIEDAGAEVRKTSNLVFDITGDYTRIGRPPYGALNHEIKAVSGFEWFNWSIDTLDWKTRNADSTYKNIMDNVGDGDVILMHDLYMPTVQAVERIVPELAEKGFQFITMKELIELKGGAGKVSGHIKK